MATETLDIANLALLKVGADFIDALTDDSTPANACKEVYAHSRDKVLILTRFGWNCAKKRINLPVENAEPSFDFDYKFRLPADCLRVLYPTDENNNPITTDWERSGDYIYSSQNECPLQYIYQLTDVEKMSPLLVEAIAVQLAVDICFRLKQSSAQKNDLIKELATILLLAEGIEASEKYAANPETVRRTSKQKWVDVK